MVKIVMYTTQTCPYCKMLKGWLESKNIGYENKFVDDDQKAMDEMLKISEGHMGVPFTVITKDDGVQIKILGFDKLKFKEILGVEE